MKILELDIENVRGIVTFDIMPNGQNIAIHGPNGSGKSAVVDAIDFLLTGDISRLAGRGTKGISLKDHGPHIDHKPKDATVKAKIQLEGIKEPLIIERRITAVGLWEITFPELRRHTNSSLGMLRNQQTVGTKKKT